MTDTRAGFWLQLAIVAADRRRGRASTSSSATPRTRRCARCSSIAVAPASVLLPIVGILLVSSEWSQRTAHDHLRARAPPRARARGQAAGQRGAVARRAGAVRRRRGHRHGGRRARASTHTWSLPVGLLGQHVVSLGTGHDLRRRPRRRAARLGAGHRLLLRAADRPGRSSGALAGLDAVARWLDADVSLAPMTEHVMSATEWAHARHDARAVDGAAAAHRPVADHARRDPLTPTVQT